MKLHILCLKFIFPGFVNIDVTNGVRKGSFSGGFNLTMQSNHMVVVVVVVVPWERERVLY